jgi:hypothetical protein
MKRSQALTIALTVVCCLLSAFGSVLLAAPVPASTAEIATAAAPSPTWLASLAQGTCRLNCTGGTLGHPNSVVIFTTFSTCCSYPGTLCPAGTTPVYGTWQPLSGALQLCPFN